MAFYDRMADTATRLLTKFGRPVTFERVTSVFNPITGMDTSRTTATTDTVGVEIPINKALIDGTRVQVGDKFIVIDASFEPMMSDRLMVGLNPPVVSCAYPLDATLAEIEALDPSAGKPAMSNGDQTGTMTLTGSLVTAKTLVAFPTAIPSGYKTVRFDSGVKVFEFDYAMPDFSGATVNHENICNASLSVVGSPTFSHVVGVEVSSGVLSDLTQSTRLYVANSTGIVAGSSPVITMPRAGRIAVRMDSATGTIQLETAAGVVELSDDTYSTSGDCIAFLTLYEEPGSPAEHAGKTMSASLVTDIAQMLYPLPDGATDICGNPPSKDISDSWAIVAIESINPAGTPVAYRVQVRK